MTFFVKTKPYFKFFRDSFQNFNIHWSHIFLSRMTLEWLWQKLSKSNTFLYLSCSACILLTSYFIFLNLWIFDHFIFCSVFDNLGGPSWARFKGVPRFWECQNQVLSAMEVVHQHWIGVFHMLEDLLEPCFPVDWPRDLLYEAIASFLPYCALHCDNVKATIPGYPPWILLLHILKMGHTVWLIP